jgi:hypothetical protein
MPGEYRGIILPLSSDGERVDFIHGTISWREPADRRLTADIEGQVARSGAVSPRPCLSALWPAAVAGAGRSRA